MSNQKENKLVQWLDQLQEQSWNLELIISGFVLFGLFQLREFLTIQLYYFNANGYSIYNKFTLSFLVLQISIDIFILSLLLLVFTRGLWIGVIGLRYVSGEIDYDSLKYSDRFKQYLKQKIGDFDNYIQRLEHISSSIFAFTYLLFFLFISLLAMDLESHLVNYLSSKIGLVKLGDRITDVFFLVGFLVFFDFITLGLLKRIKFPIFSAIYLPIYRFYSAATLSFLWRPIWYNFIDQRSTRWIAAFIVPVLIGFIFYKDVPFALFDYQFFPKIQHRTDINPRTTVASIENGRASFQAQFYDDLREAERKEKKYEIIRLFSLPTHRIDAPLVEVFVKYDKSIEDFITRADSSIITINEVGFNILQDQHAFANMVIKRTKSEYDRQQEQRYTVFEQQYDSLQSVDEIQASNSYLAYLDNEFLLYRSYLEHMKSIIKQSFSFEINAQPVPDSTINLDFHIHPNFGEKGFICTFPMQHAQLGRNLLTLKRKFYNETRESYYERDYTIPFIYTGIIATPQQN
ncbi:MAG: hypothetical protein AAF806_03155 [Bacteroidota bacterium]